MLAPDFSLLDLDGAPHSLAELRSAGPVLVVFFKVSCPVCQLTLPYLDRVPGRVVAISQDEAAPTRRFQARFGVSLLTLLDSEQQGYPVSNAYKITHVPTLFLVEADGAISRTLEGFVKSDLEALGVAFRQDESVPQWKAG